MSPIRRRLRSAFAFAAATALVAGAVSTGRPRSCLAESWVDGKVFGPFVCRAEFPLADIKGLLGELAQVQRDLVRYLGVPPAQEPIELYLFRDKHSFTRYIKRRFPEVPWRRALYIKGQGPGMVFAYRSGEFETDVRHECTHALLHAVLPVVPLWLDEGLAEYFEVPPGRRAFDNPHLRSLQWNLRFGAVPRIGDLEKKGGLAEMGRTDYRYSWAWVHFMLHGPREAHAELVGYLQDIRASTPPGLLSQRLQHRLPGVQQRFAAHFNSWKR